MRLVFALIIVIIFSPMLVFAGGLSSNWGEVIIDNLEPGKNYDLNKFLNTTFKISNNFDTDITLKIKILVPEENELKPGYEVIKDISWVKVEGTAAIPARETKTIPVLLNIPNDAEYYGKKYQFWIWSYTEGESMGVGLKSRIMFSVIPKMKNELATDERR